jgi:hypothetical protein
VDADTQKTVAVVSFGHGRERDRHAIIAPLTPDAAREVHEADGAYCMALFSPNGPREAGRSRQAQPTLGKESSAARCLTGRAVLLGRLAIRQSP